MVFCISISADRDGMIVSRFLAATSARGILLCLAAENRKSYCCTYIKITNGTLESE